MTKQYRMKYPSLSKSFEKPIKTVTRPYLYGAYGSNLNEKQMKLRCPRAKKIGLVRLPDHELVFRGVADMEKNEGSEIMLGIWEITNKCEAALDRYEGFPHLYNKKFFDINITYFDAVYDRSETSGISLLPKVRLMTYQMTNQSETYRPDTGYLQSIVNGFCDFEIPKDSLETALANSYLRETTNVNWRG